MRRMTMKRDQGPRRGEGLSLEGSAIREGPSQACTALRYALPYRGTSLIRNSPPPRTTIGP